MKTIIQKLLIQEKDVFSIAEKYYAILSVLNNLKLTEREIQLVGFTAVRGSISYRHFREEFCKKHNTSSATINNMISKLKKINLLIKDKDKIKVNPVILLNFNDNLNLAIRLEYRET